MESLHIIIMENYPSIRGNILAYIFISITFFYNTIFSLNDCLSPLINKKMCSGTSRF